MGYGPLGGNLRVSREHGKTPSVPHPGRNPPHRSQAARMNATLENRVDAGLSQAQGGKDSYCPSPGRLPPLSPLHNRFLCSRSSASLRVPSKQES